MPLSSPRIAAIISLLAAGAVPAAPVLKERYVVRDGGQVRSFETVVEAPGVARYETGVPRKASARRVVTPGVLVRLENPAEAAAIAAQSGAASWKPAPVLEDAVIFTFHGNAGEALPAAESLR